MDVPAVQPRTRLHQFNENQSALLGDLLNSVEWNVLRSGAANLDFVQIGRSTDPVF